MSLVEPGEPYATGWERFIYGVPWALLLILGVLVYVVIEQITDHLAAADAVKAITGIAGLAIGHGVHEHVHYLRLRATAKHPKSSAGS